MDPEQTFIRVQERFSELLTAKIRAKLEYFFLLLAVTLFCILVVMHANYVQQPGCSSEFSSAQMSDAQLIQIKITSAGLWSHNEPMNVDANTYNEETGAESEEPHTVDDDGSPHLADTSWLSWISADAKMVKSRLEFWKTDTDVLESQRDVSVSSERLKPSSDDVIMKVSKDVPRSRFFVSPKESLRAAIFHIGRKWHGRLSFFLRFARRLLGGLWDIAGINLSFDIPKWLKILHLDRFNSYAVQWLEKRSKAFEPAYLYTMEKLLLIFAALLSRVIFCCLKKPDQGMEFIQLISVFQLGIIALATDTHQESKTFTGLTKDISMLRQLKHSLILPMLYKLHSLSSCGSCLTAVKLELRLKLHVEDGRWQQLLINRVVGYDTILMNSLLDSPGQGYLYNYQTKEFYNLTYAHEQPESSAKFGDYLVTKCGVLMMSLFVFFTTTMSVSFTLRETQTRMLKFTVQLQHHARHRLPTFQLIFVHVIESLVFVPIMIGILFFLFEFYDDQLLAFMVLILVWICELFTLISVRTPISMKFFPRFFLLYFLVFHIYFFSYTYGFSYLALSTSAAFMQHLVLYFWNRFEVPALQRFMQNRRSNFQQHPDFHITSSTILASTLRITRFNTRNTAAANRDTVSPPVPQVAAETGTPRNVTETEQPTNNNPDRLGNPLDIGGGQPQPETGGIPGAMSSFSSLLLWILGGASSESLNSFLSIFRDFRDQGQVYPEPPQQETRTAQNTE